MEEPMRASLLDHQPSAEDLERAQQMKEKAKQYRDMADDLRGQAFMLEFPVKNKMSSHAASQ
jgi:hypothetical protein